MNRLKEIENRKAEIRAALEKNDETIDFDGIKAELEALNAEEAQLRKKAEIADLINSGTVETRTIGTATSETKQSTDANVFESVEYRNAFKNYVATGKMAAEYRDVSKTTENAAVIPTPVLDRIIEKMESYGNILPLVTQLAYPAGVAIPTANMGITATFVAEGEGSKRQKVATANIVFGKFKLQCRVAVSLEVDTMALSAFETSIVGNISKAMVKAIEEAIIKGTGSGAPKGITLEEVPADRKVEVKAFDYATLISIETAIPEAYNANAIYCMSKATYYEMLGMTDKNGQPVAKLNVGTSGKLDNTLFGRSVVFTEHIKPLKTAGTGEVVAFVFDFSNYVINSNMQLTMKRYIDEETDDTITKATMLLDGKTVDNNGLVFVTKKG